MYNKVEESTIMVQVKVIINIVMATLKTIKILFDKYILVLFTCYLTVEMKSF
jgi:hypothetical protein